MGQNTNGISGPNPKHGGGPLPVGASLCEWCVNGLEGPGDPVQCALDREWRQAVQVCSFYKPDEDPEL